MTDWQDTHGAAVATRTGFGQQVANLSGAVVSLALVGAMGMWGYELMVRDVKGVPVIRALEGAYRAEPDDPGGLRAANQGLAVNEVAADGAAGTAAETVRLAPPAQRLMPDDKPVATLLVEARPKATPETGPEAPAVAALAVDPADDAVARVEALGLPEPEAAAPEGTEVASAAPDTIEMTEPVAEATITDAVPTVATVSPRPAPRPRRVAAVATPTISPANVQVVASVPADPARISVRPATATGIQQALAEAVGTVSAPRRVGVRAASSGGRLVQLGAYASEDVARGQWSRIVARAPEAFDGKSMVVQPASSGGSTFWRLRAAGFRDGADAHGFCNRLKAAGQDCLPVAQ